MEELKKQYRKIFNKYSMSEFQDRIKRDFCFQFDSGLNKPDILFVGINPSYSGSPILQNHYSKKDVSEISYYKSFEKVVNSLDTKKVTWSHLDLLVFRETKQAYISDVLLKSEEGIMFIDEQLLISKILLEKLNPKIIVVSNTMARRFLGKEKNNNKNVWLGYNFEFCKEVGTDKIIEGALKNTPVFFTSMLSGQRALDNGSKERLSWHINKVLKNIQNNV